MREGNEEGEGGESWCAFFLSLLFISPLPLSMASLSSLT